MWIGHISLSYLPKDALFLFLPIDPAVVFDPPKEPRLDHRTGKLIAQTLSPDLPLLSVHNLQLVGPWTGPGAQVRGMLVW